MSTLGDLLAEHTMLPGNAVDHLHAVVGEWQLLADLSFADYLMWVRRDDGVLVCVAQCRPNTAPTVLLTDAVGTVAAAADLPLVTAAFKSGAIGREAEEGQPNSTTDGDISMEAVPVRYDNKVVAVLTHQTAFAARKASPLERAYLDCAADLLHMLSEGTFPNVENLSISRSSPRVGDGFIRLDVAGVVVFASPNALSAYHRMGLTAELEGQNLVGVTRPLISDPFGRGWDIFGTVDFAPNLSIVSYRTVWYVQVAALVIGHVAGLAIAHDRAVVVFPHRRSALEAQLPMLGLMVLYTVAGMWLLSQS